MSGWLNSQRMEDMNIVEKYYQVIQDGKPILFKYDTLERAQEDIQAWTRYGMDAKRFSIEIMTTIALGVEEENKLNLFIWEEERKNYEVNALVLWGLNNTHKDNVTFNEYEQILLDAYYDVMPFPDNENNCSHGGINIELWNKYMEELDKAVREYLNKNGWDASGLDLVRK